MEREAVRAYRSLHFVGGPEKVRAQIEALVEETGVNEIMVATTIHGHRERLRSYELVAEAFGLPGR
jgi:alkanesulfonate monooxygenase SsuD/methylene tetrahydromethanopterin reductase-like flavin-dependent oxidoreductase (luciferase family)